MRFRQPGVLCSVDLATTPTLDQHPKVPADFWVESNSSSAPRRYRVSGTRSRLIRPSVRQCSLEHRLDSLGCFRYRAPSHRDPPGRSLEPRHFPTGGFIPRDRSAPTHSGVALGISTVQGFVPSVQRHSTRRRALPPCRWCLRHSPGFPGCHGADPRLRGLLPQRRCRVPFVVLPTTGARSPLQVLSSSGTRISLLGPVDRSRRLLPLMALVLRTLTSPK